MRLMPLWLLAVVACSSADERAPIAAANDEATDPATAAPSAAEVEASPATAELDPGTDRLGVLRFDDGATPRIVSLPASTIVIAGEPLPEGSDDEYAAMIRGPSTGPIVEFPQHADALNRQLREVALRTLRELGVTGGGACRAVVARPDLVVIACEGTVLPDRGYPYRVAQGSHLRVRAARLEPFAMREALLPGAELDDEIRRRCRRTLGDRLPYPSYCADAPQDSSLYFTARGIRVDYPARDDETTTVRAEIPYAALDGVILADGPLGPALAQGARVERVPRPAAVAARQGRAVADRAGLSVLMHRWAALDAAGRAEVRLAVDAEGFGRLVVDDSVAEPRADTLAVALGEEASESARWDSDPVEIVWARTAASVNLRARPRDTLMKLAIPQGTLVLALRGRVARRESTLGRRDTWAFTSPAPELSGWAAGNLLREHDGCRPITSALLASLPASARERATRSLLTTLATLRRGARETPVVITAAALRPMHEDRGGGRLVISVHALEAGCRLGPRLARHEHDGALWTLGLTTARPHEGDSLLVVATRHGRPNSRPMRVNWTIYGSAPEPVWSGDINDPDEHRFGVSADSGEYAVLEVERFHDHVRVERTEDGYATRTIPRERE